MARPVSIVSGAASGIGRHMARALHRAGHRLVLTDIDEVGLGRMASDHGLAGDEAVLLSPLDVRDASGWERLKERTLERFGVIDFLLNIAGFLRPGYAHEVTPEDVDRQLDVNVKGVMFATRAIAPVMIAQGRGHIVNVASLAGLSAVPGLSAYCASKHAVRGFSLSIAHELAPHGVHVSVLCPDAVETPMLWLQEKYPEAAMVFAAGRALTLDQVEAAFFRILREKPLEVVLGVPGSGRSAIAKFANLFPGAVARFTPLVVKRGLELQKRRAGSA